MGRLGRPLDAAVVGGRLAVTSRLSIRRTLAILLGVLGVLVAAVFVLTTLQLRGANLQTEAENRRTESFRLADQMRQTSNDLTRMVRMYVATGDPRFRDHYEEILASPARRACCPSTCSRATRAGARS